MHKERSHCVDVCILRGSIFNFFFQGVTAPGLRIFFQKYLAFSIPPKPFWEFDETCCKERLHYVDMHILSGTLFIFFKELQHLDLKHLI
jgi:hypothetical protein